MSPPSPKVRENQSARGRARLRDTVLRAAQSVLRREALSLPDTIAFTDVRVADDLGVATLLYTRLPGAPPKAEIDALLAGRRGAVRAALGRALTQRITPEIRFQYDDAADKSARVESIFAEIAREREENALAPDTEVGTHADAPVDNPAK